jgi:diadenylate cyclase
MGITEETDAVALIVSEETGALSICFKGKLAHDLEPEELRERLDHILNGDTNDDEDREDTTREMGA